MSRSRTTTARLIGLLALAAALALFTSGPARAAETTKFDQAAERVAHNLAQAKAERERIRAEQAAEQAELEQRLAGLETQIAQEKAARARAAEELKAAHAEQARLTDQLAEAAGDLEVLVGHVRAAARDLLALAQKSPLTAEHPGRLKFLAGFLDKTRYPGLDEITKLIDQFFLQIEGDRQISARQGGLIDDSGLEKPARLVRLGGFCTIYDRDGKTGYAQISPSSGRLLALAGDPGWLIDRNLRAYLAGESDQVYLDISGGTALGMLSQKTGWWEHLLSGGPLVWPILAVGLLALVFILERLIFLGRVRANTDQLMDRVNDLVAQGDYDQAYQAVRAQAGRPTSNVIRAGLDLRGRSAEAIESGLSEAMLKELPRLERFLTILKVLAAVAPLLGLLGTVTGMINTFHVITAFGAGEPRLMAGGISEALVTTQLGLAVAIPIMVAAALLGRKAQKITGDMEEKAVALSAALIGRRMSLDEAEEAEA